MKKPHDKVDELLHRALHDLHSPASESDWEAIRQRLRKEKPKAGAFRLNKIILLSSLLLLATASGLLIRNNMREKSKVTVSAQAPAPHKQNPPVIAPELQSAESLLTNESNSRKSTSPGTKANQAAGLIPLNEDESKTGEFNQELPSPLAKRALSYSPQIVNGMAELKPEGNPLRPLMSASPGTTGNKAGQWRFTLCVMPFVSTAENSLNASKVPATHKDYLSLVTASEKSTLSLSAGVEAERPVFKNISVQSGIRYIQQRETVRYDFYNREVPVIDARTGEILGYVTLSDSQRTEYRGTNTYHYALIPLALTYELPLTRKLSLGLKAGGLVQLNLGANGQTIRPDDLTLESIQKSNLRKITTGYTLAAGIYYQLGPQLSIGLLPTYQRQMQSMYNSEAVRQQKTDAAGINAALRISLF